MAGEEKAEKIQRELFRDLSGEITDEELNKIKQELKQKQFGGFKAGEIQRELKTTDDILEKLKRRRLIQIGDYGLLRKLFNEINSPQLLDSIDKAENALLLIRWPVKQLEQNPPQRVPMHESMDYDPRGMYPQANPPPYSHPPQPSSYPSYQHPHMGPPQHPAPHTQHRAQHPYQERVTHMPPQMAPPVPQQQYVDGRGGAFQQSGFQQYSPSIDVQLRGGPMPSVGDDVSLPNNNILEEDETDYKPGRGYVLFINNLFTGKNDERHGAVKDKENVEALFEKTLKGYYLQYVKDVTKEILMSFLSSLKQTLNTDRYNSFIFILGTHGEPRRAKDGGPTKDAVLMHCGQWVLVEDIISSFYGDQIPNMKDKPKVFIIQSCRGKQLQRSVSLSDGPATVSNPETQNYDQPAVTTRPVNSDTLIAYATSEGTKAWRNQDEGSWFVFDLCDIIRRYYDREHILDILVRVNSRMVQREATESRAKQMPCFTCTFTKRFFLMPSSRSGPKV